ncbi:hypothetical protein CA850_10140 [Micromonospora echinospora]|uniref:LPXTG-motif cell wall anchor domain-containing protein n=1 Tax=Micromonospora echinospora TaxID=1877 RepID=A0A1C4ZM50_MICEC|nr:hypothetical protein [Micromonospora echinospora]OZV81531.1 hypothetical protein CA850_10140 [Micromonospora echinospora]SCF33854.1 hypothetical protein GA0070618_5451 [Micromonospora echinospora]
MRLSRIITTIAVGLAAAAMPGAAGAALSQPQPPPQPSQSAQPPPYQPPQRGLTVSPSTVEVGEIATVTGRGYYYEEQVEITITSGPLAAGLPGQETARRGDGSTVALAPVSYHRAAPQPGEPNGPEHVPSKGPWNGSPDGARQVFWIRADDDGGFQFAFRPRHPGTITITARGLTSGYVGTATLTVLRPHQGDDDDPLPVTGSSLETPLKVGGGLVGVGAVLLLTTFALRRRNRVGADTAS